MSFKRNISPPGRRYNMPKSYNYFGKNYVTHNFLSDYPYYTGLIPGNKTQFCKLYVMRIANPACASQKCTLNCQSNLHHKKCRLDCQSDLRTKKINRDSNPAQAHQFGGCQHHLQL